MYQEMTHRRLSTIEICMTLNRKLKKETACRTLQFELNKKKKYLSTFPGKISATLIKMGIRRTKKGAAHL